MSGTATRESGAHAPGPVTMSPERRPSPATLAARETASAATRAALDVSRAAKRIGACGTVAVLDGLNLHALGRASVPHGLGPGANLCTCSALARDGGLRQLWLTPAALEALGLPVELPAKPGPHGFLEHFGTAPASQIALAPRLSAWGAGGSWALEVLVPSWDRRSPWRRLTYAPALLAELVDFVDATGMLWKGSGAVTSDAWLRAYYGAKLERLEWPPPAADANLEPNLLTARRPLEDEARARWLMAFDVNGMYLSAASSLALPAGQYAHEDEAPASPRPGYWHLATGWAATPTMRAFPWPFAPELEAYTWAESHRYLEPWYRTLRDGRTRLLETGAGVALAALKSVYREGVGRFGSVARTRSDDPLYVPYWRHAVQAEARTRLERHVAGLSQSPVAVDVDCLFFLTAARKPERFARALGLRLGDGLGAFRFVGMAPAREAREALEEPNIHGAVKALRELVKMGDDNAAK